jgi:hypothetical protein
LRAYARHLEDLSAAKRRQRDLFFVALSDLRSMIVTLEQAVPFQETDTAAPCTFHPVLGLVRAYKSLPTFSTNCPHGWLEAQIQSRVMLNSYLFPAF